MVSKIIRDRIKINKIYCNRIFNKFYRVNTRILKVFPPIGSKYKVIIVILYNILYNFPRRIVRKILIM